MDRRGNCFGQNGYYFIWRLILAVLHFRSQKSMIRSLQRFFDAFVEPASSGGQADGEHAVQVATAALIVEMMRIDDAVSSAELEVAARVLRERFSLDQAETEALLDVAGEQMRDAVGYHDFTSRLNKALTPAQRVKVVEYMWQVAFADGKLDANENHLMRRIGDLLYVSHGDYVAAKIRARAAVAGGSSS